MRLMLTRDPARLLEAAAKNSKPLQEFSTTHKWKMNLLSAIMSLWERERKWVEVAKLHGSNEGLENW